MGAAALRETYNASMFPWNRTSQEIQALRTQVHALRAVAEKLAARAGVSQSELDHMLSTANPGITDEVDDHLRAGRKVSAIKAYRESTGAGLKEAKDAVEAYERQQFGRN